MVDGLPEKKYQITPQEVAVAKVANPFLLTGSNPTLTGDNLIVFLEYVAHGGSLVIKDKAGNSLTATITDTLDLTSAPLRVDGGVTLAGTIKMAKGFYLVLGN